MLLANVIECLMPDYLMAAMGLFCLAVYITGYAPKSRDKYNTHYVFMCVLSVIYVFVKIVVIIVPSFLCSFWAVFLGLFALGYSYPKVHRRNQTRNMRRREQSRIILEQKCCICLDKNTTHVVYPCLHASYCS
jgi:hypothetical protein